MGVIQQGEISIKASVNLISSLGQRLYPKADIAIIELICNSYDADATEVKITKEEGVINVQDNGCGMDQEGLANFFFIGKSSHKPSGLGRAPIGQFGIGKFSMLCLCSQFEVLTRRGDFKARVIYNEEDVREQGEELTENTLPLEILDDDIPVGTKVTLRGMKKPISIPELKRIITEKIMMQPEVSSFKITVNDEPVSTRYIHGQRYPVNFSTQYGPVTGEVIWANDKVDMTDVDGVLSVVLGRGVDRSLFGVNTNIA